MIFQFSIFNFQFPKALSLRGAHTFLRRTKQSISIGVLAVVLTACTSSLTLPEKDLTPPALAPQALALEDDSGNALGYASVLRSNVLVAPDHVWQASGELYLQNQPIEVLARDFRHDLFFFTVPQMAFSQVPNWSTEPPGVGQNLWWSADESTAMAPVFSAKVDFELGQTKLEGLMSLAGVTAPGDSGKALYDESTKLIYGMLVATDTLEELSYFVRSDTILALAEEYLD